MLIAKRKQAPYFISALVYCIVSLTCAVYGAEVSTENKDNKDNKVSKGYNLIMISINNIGAEHMSLYGYGRKTTPYLDKWAHDAIVFENAFSSASWTLPAATSLFTSLYPYTHKVMHRYRTNLLNKNIKTLPEIMKENNYRTAAFTGGLDYYKEFGHMRGFEYTDNNPDFTGFDVTLSQARNWLSQNSDKKFFLFIHGYTAHPPFTPPKEFKGIFSNPQGKNITVDPRFCLRGYKNQDNEYVAYYLSQRDPFAGTRPSRLIKEIINMPQERKVILTQDDIDYLRDLYDEEILYTDYMVGEFLNSLGKDLLKKTIIVIFSEHGEMFAKHGRFGRAGTTRGTLYDNVLHIPLIIKMPLADTGSKKVKGLVQIIDIMPTVLDVLGVSSPQKIQGKSLLSLIEDNKPVNDYVFAGLQYNIGRPAGFDNPVYDFRSINESIRDHNWKLIREIKFLNSNLNKSRQTEEEIFELYDLRSDPDELINLVDEHPGITKLLRSKLSAWVKWTKDFVLVYPSTKEVPEDLLRNAREHGYW